MASVCRDPNGAKRILFIDSKGDRKAVRLGKVNQRTAENVKQKIEALVAAIVAQTSPDRETSDWVGRLDGVLYDRLAAVGLVPQRERAKAATLGGFICDYLAMRSDIKRSTATNLELVRDDLYQFFGNDRPLASINEGHADEFRA